MRWSPAKYASRASSGCATCGSPYAEGDPTVYDGEKRATIRCSKCPDLSPQDQREIARIVESAKAKAATAKENLERAKESAGDWRVYIEQAGDNLGIAIPMIGAHEGIAADCRRHGIAVSSLIAAFVHMAASDVTRRNCTVASWMSAAQNCAEWGLLPTTAGDTPVYLFCRDTKSMRLSCERTRWGYATQIARALPDSEIVVGWTFQPEALLGDLASRIRDRKPGAQEQADQIRADLEKRAGGIDPDQAALAAGLRAYFDDNRAFPDEHKGALARAGKAAPEGPLRDGLRAIYARKPLTEEQREAVMEARMDLDAGGSSLTPAEESLLAALRLPGWHLYPWYLAAGPAEERTIEWSPPSFALWQRPPMNPRRLDGVPSVWWCRLTFTDGTLRREIGFELARDQVYERALAGKTVALSSTGLLVPASEKQTPWIDWHGEMGAVKTLREMLKAHPVLFERLRAHVGALEEESVIEGETVPTVGVDHLRRVRQIEEQTHLPDFEPVSEKTAVQQEVGAK